tara:strand:- start:308 stop:598 length:291 start_codon:yes stop_codon:yes gene_type:complete
LLDPLKVGDVDRAAQLHQLAEQQSNFHGQAAQNHALCILTKTGASSFPLSFLYGLKTWLPSMVQAKHTFMLYGFYNLSSQLIGPNGLIGMGTLLEK